MKMTLILILSLLTQSAFGATAQVNSIIQSGGGVGTNVSSTVPISDLSRRITLVFNNVAGGAPSYAGAYKMGGTGTTQYQVPSTKVTYCFNMTVGNTGGAQALLVGYATSTFTNETGSAPSGAAYFAASGTASQGIQVKNAAAGVYDSFPIVFSFSANNYPFVEASAGGTVHVFMDCMEI